MSELRTTSEPYASSDQQDDAGPQLSLVIVEIAGTRYGVDLTQVRRIDLDEPTESLGPVLGAVSSGRRALVFDIGSGRERRLPIDVVLGVRSAKLTDLRAMPKAAHAAPYSIGAWLDGDDTIILIDLPSMVPPSPESPHGH